MRLKTRLTEKLGVKHPILLAPMNVMAGGKLAAAVSDAGGLGLSAAAMATPIGLSCSTRQRGMHGSAADSLPGRSQEARSCSIRFLPSSQQL